VDYRRKFLRDRKMLYFDSIVGNICLPQNCIAKVYELQQCEFHVKRITELGWAVSKAVVETRMKKSGWF
jgi:hypothetical protein